MALTPSTLRHDLKCGKGAISKGEKCHVGPASSVASPQPGAFPTGKAIAAGLTAGAIGAALLHKGSRKAILSAPANSRRVAQRAITEVVHRTTAKPPTMRLTPKAFEQLKPPSKTERLHIAAKTANQEAERAIAKAAEAEVERAAAVGNAMFKAGKATRASLRSGTRRHNLTVEKLRRRYEPGYRRPTRGSGRGDATSGHQFYGPHYIDPASPRGDGPSTDYYRSHPEARAKKVRHQAEINRRPEEKDRRVSLTRERRRRGIAGKGGPDVSHTSSGGTVLEDPAKNRARNGAGGKPRLKADSTWAVGFDTEDGKKYTKVVTNPKTGRKNKVRYGAKGYTIAPSTDKGDNYCARSFGDMKSHGKDCSGPDRNTPLCLSRAKWKCSGKTSRRSA
jgi:hypothetical protein